MTVRVQIPPALIEWAVDRSGRDAADLRERFPALVYDDVAGVCKAVITSEIEAQGWSLNPGRYVGAGARAADEFDFAGRLGALQEELETLNFEAQVLQQD